jgi:3-phenylpropionate/cinnamic acid dioxygenase small subunit
MSVMSDSVKEISDMIHRYCELFDSGDFDAFSAQFANGRWFRAQAGAPATRAWIDRWVITYDGSPRTQHLTSNLVVEVDDVAGTATARSYVTVMQAAPGLALQPVFGGRYHDRFERVGGRWQWRERNVIGDLYGDTSHHVRQQ